MTRLALLLVGAAAAGCAHDLHTRYPGSNPGDPSATLVLHFTGAVDDAYVSINGVPVAEDAHTQEIVVEGVPPGEAAIVVAAEGGFEKAFVLNLQRGQRVVIPLSAPAPSAGRTILQTLLTAAIYAVYLVLL